MQRTLLLAAMALLVAPNPALSRSCLVLPECVDIRLSVPLELLSIEGPEGADPPAFFGSTTSLVIDGNGEARGLDFIAVELTGFR